MYLHAPLGDTSKYLASFGQSEWWCLKERNSHIKEIYSVLRVYSTALSLFSENPILPDSEVQHFAGWLLEEIGSRSSVVYTTTSFLFSIGSNCFRYILPHLNLSPLDNQPANGSIPKYYM